MCATNRLYSKNWEFIIKKNYHNAANFITHDYHLVKGPRAKTLDKLTLTEIYSIFILKVQNKPFSNIFLENLFNDNGTDWAAIHMLPCLVTYNTYMRSFQYKIPNNFLFLNNKISYFWNKIISTVFFL